MDGAWTRFLDKVKSRNCNRPELSQAEQLKKRNNEKTRALFFEALFYSLFLALLLITSYNNRDDVAYLYRTSIFKAIDPASNFSEIRTRDQMWKWTQTTLLSYLYRDANRSGASPAASRHLVSDLVSYKTGPVRLRQHRTKDGPCSVSGAMEHLNIRCSPSWSSQDRDQSNYGRKWESQAVTASFNSDVMKNVSSFTVTSGSNLTESTKSSTAASTSNLSDSVKNNSSHWTYTTWSDIGGLPITGNLGFYPPGGYVLEVSHPKDDAKDQLQNAQKDLWVDNRTRVVLLELTLYSPSVNMFAMVTAMFEFPQADVILSKMHIHPFRLFLYLGRYRAAMMACDYLVYAATVWFVLREAARLCTERIRYFKKFWNILKFANVLTSIAVIVLHVGKQIINDRVTKNLGKNNGTSYNFQTLALWDELFGFLLGFVCFMSILQILHLLRFNKRMSVLGATMMKSATDLLSFSLVLAIVLVAFICFSYVIFGNYLKPYRTAVDTLESLMRVALGQLEYKDMAEVSRIFTPAFVLLYSMFIIFILLNILVSILTDAFAAVRNDVNEQPNDHELIDYMVSTATVFLWNYSPFRVAWRAACRIGLTSNSQPASTREIAIKPDEEANTADKVEEVPAPTFHSGPKGRLSAKLMLNVLLAHQKLDRMQSEVDCIWRMGDFGNVEPYTGIFEKKTGNIIEDPTIEGIPKVKKSNKMGNSEQGMKYKSHHLSGDKSKVNGSDDLALNHGLVMEDVIFSDDGDIRGSSLADQMVPRVGRVLTRDIDTSCVVPGKYDRPEKIDHRARTLEVQAEVIGRFEAGEGRNSSA